MKKYLRQSANLWAAAIMAIAGLGVQSCSEDTYPDVGGPDGEQADLGMRRYFSMQIATADAEGLLPGDRDFTLQDGSVLEHAVDMSGASDNVVILFNDDWTYFGYASIDYDHQFSQGSHDSETEETSYIGVIHSPDPEKIYGLPSQGLIVFNAYNITEALDRLALNPNATIADVLKLTDAAAAAHKPGMSGPYHTMTSTAYLEPDGSGWRHSMVFKLDPKKIYEYRQQALASPAAVAFVERMDSKFSIKFSGADNPSGLSYIPDKGRAQVIVCNYSADGNSNYNYRNWTCTVDAWGINKYESEAYYFRDIVGKGADTSSYPYTYPEDINSTGLPFYNGWNRYSLGRAFWGRDPHYDDGIYPRQYRQAVDNIELEYYGLKGQPSLCYVSYNELSSDFSKLGTPEGPSLYSTENTFPDTRMGGLWQHDLAGSELLIGARIHIDRVDETRSDYDLFRNRIGVFYPSVTDFATYFINTFNDQLASHSRMTYRYYDWEHPANNTEEDVMKEVNLTYDNFRLYYGDRQLTPELMASLASYTIPATVEHGDGKVIPWIEGMYIGRRSVNPDTYEEEGEIYRLKLDPDDFKSIIFDWIGAFEHFNKGRMVYAVPIQHKATDEKVADPTFRPSVGDFGVARNTWYSFDITGIDHMGDPIDDPDQKIIVYRTDLQNSIQVETKVLEWHIFETEVTLPGNLK